VLPAAAAVVAAAVVVVVVVVVAALQQTKCVFCPFLNCPVNRLEWQSEDE